MLLFDVWLVLNLDLGWFLMIRNVSSLYYNGNLVMDKRKHLPKEIEGDTQVRAVLIYNMIKRTFENGNKEVDDMGILIIRQEKGK